LSLEGLTSETEVTILPNPTIKAGGMQRDPAALVEDMHAWLRRSLCR
jgi:hypothetical protein